MYYDNPKHLCISGETGQMFDKESGLYYYNARYYDANVGIFITPDPAMSGLNHYAYCSANPINYTDPTGLEEGGNWGLIDFIVGSCISLVANIISWCSGHMGVGYNSTIMGSIGLLADAINQVSGANIQVAPQYRDLSYTTQDWIPKTQNYTMPDTNRSYPDYDKPVNTSSDDGTVTAKEVESNVTQSSNEGEGLGGGTGELGNGMTFQNILDEVFSPYGSSPIDKKDWLANNCKILPAGVFGDKTLAWKRGGPHSGIDITCKKIGINIRTTGKGTVLFAGYTSDDSYGYQVIVDHGYGLTTRYNHLNSIADNIKKGEVISDHTIIGTLGMSGNATGSHLDYEVKIGKVFIDPKMVLPDWYNDYYPK